MSQKLGNINIILTNSILDLKKKEKVKSDLINENSYYSLINKKRKRNSSNKKMKIIINKCPSCASSLLEKHYKHIHDKNIDNNNNIFENKNKRKKEISCNYEQNPNLSNKNENNQFIINNSPSFNVYSKLLFKNEDVHNQETFSKNHNILQKCKESEITKVKENKDELFDKRIINEKSYYKDNNSHTEDITQNNIIKSSIFDLKEMNKAENKSSINNAKENKNNERLNKTINYQRKKTIHNQLPTENTQKKKEFKEKISELASPTIFLKVKKCVAPEI